MDDLIEQTANDISNIIPRLMQSFVLYIRECADYNFPVAHFRIIAMLMDHPMKISDLAKLQNVSKASISESVKMLFERGWIVKTHDPIDKRVVSLQVSDDGKRQMEEMHERMRTNIKKKLSQTPEKELLIIKESLKILNDKFTTNNHGGLH
jgi:DNA-binding MarR family transcriptional regulator